MEQALEVEPYFPKGRRMKAEIQKRIQKRRPILKQRLGVYCIEHLAASVACLFVCLCVCVTVCVVCACVCLSVCLQWPATGCCVRGKLFLNTGSNFF